MMVRIREPLTAQQLETTTERWLVIDHLPAAVPTVSPAHQPPLRGRLGSRTQYSLDWLSPLKQVTGPKAKVPPIATSWRDSGNR